MRFRLGMVTGFAAGYYMGARAGRERYQQINSALRRVRRSDAFEATVEKTKSAVVQRVDVARDRAEELVENRLGNGQSHDQPLS